MTVTSKHVPANISSIFLMLPLPDIAESSPDHVPMLPHAAAIS